MRIYNRRRSQYQVIEGVQELCRLCMGKATEKVPIFVDTNNICASLAMRIMTCVGLEITPEDCLPNVICTECQKQLNNYYEFKKKCILTYQKLKSHMKAVQQMKALKAEELKMAEKSQNIAVAGHSIGSYEELVTVTVCENQPLQSTPNSVPYATVVKNTDSPAGETIQDSVIKCLPKKEVLSEKPSTAESPIQSDCQNMSEFLSTLLLELHVLKKDGDEILLKDSSLRTVEIEAGDETVITLDMLEIEEEMPFIVEAKSTSQAVPGDNAQSEATAPQAEQDGRPRCAECGRTFASGGALRRHARVHSGERPFVCPVCKRAFAQREVLTRHELVHMEERPFKCTACPKSFTQRGALDAHSRTHAAPHARALAIHNCTKCTKVFLHASGLSRHMMVHKGRGFDCGVCKRRFNDQSSLLRHIRVMHIPTEGQPADAAAPSAHNTATVTQAQINGVCT